LSKEDFLLPFSDTISWNQGKIQGYQLFPAAELLQDVFSRKMAEMGTGVSSLGRVNKAL